MVPELPLLAGWILTESDCHLGEGRPCQSPTATSVKEGRAKTLHAIPSANGSIGLDDCLTNGVAAICDMLCACEDLRSLLSSRVCERELCDWLLYKLYDFSPRRGTVAVCGVGSCQRPYDSGALLLDDEYLMFWSFEKKIA
ncbi:hypothetical protein TNCV_4540411 [Trichonephila clavipes]|nr:hypothetical protein TNCV_4540411 [Trichonephila clavipes]